MPDPSIPSTIHSLLLSFATCFTAPGFESFTSLVSGWIVCPGRHTISRIIQAAGRRGRDKHHSSLYRFLSKTRWCADSLGRVLWTLLLPMLSDEIVAPVDDTLCRRTGPHFFGAGMHHDTARSTYRDRSGPGGRHVSFAFGHSWVIFAVWVPMPWDRSRGLAVPILFRLYRQKTRCPESAYRKRTELADELIKLVSGWLPEGRTLVVVGDGEYSCKTVVRRLPQNVDFIGSMPMDAALHAKARSYRGVGRRPYKGKRLPSPAKIAARRSGWKRVQLAAYGKETTILVQTLVCLWPTVARDRLVRVVITRDPRGRYDDRAYFSTQPDTSVEQLLATFALRWEIEVAIRNAKQHMGLGDPQNGWWRRKHGTRAAKKRTGPNPRGRRGEKAVRRTLPLCFVAYGLVIVWYLRHGDREADVRRARSRAPWYTHKRTPSFIDMLTAARRESWTARFSADPSIRRVHPNLSELLEVLWAA